MLSVLKMAASTAGGKRLATIARMQISEV